MFRNNDGRIFTEKELITDYNYPTISDAELEYWNKSSTELKAIWKKTIL